MANAAADEAMLPRRGREREDYGGALWGRDFAPSRKRIHEIGSA